MKIAFILYDGLTVLDFIGVYDPVTRLRSMGFLPDLEWDLCAFSSTVVDPSGLGLSPIRRTATLAGYDLLVVPGGPGSRNLASDQAFLTWMRTAADVPRLASVCTGSLLLAAAGFLEGKYATTHPNAREELESMGVRYFSARLVEDGKILSSGGVTAGLDLGLYLCRQLAGDSVADKIRRQMDYPWPLINPVRPSSIQPSASRASQVSRQTGETRVEVTLRLDGSGQHQIDTGLPFFDHMLAQVAVHGLFDLVIQARGDLQIDPHHTIEDVGLALGQAFQEALGDRAGIVRMASADCPMDESLAWAAVDFSGRPYAVIQCEWHSPNLGGIPISLFPHFLESFASAAKCNLHARISYGRDDHHQAEALFKAFGRALCAASRFDPRRSGSVPSTKGILF
jgi:imidazoleglycerol-phosphate dehydratase